MRDVEQAVADLGDLLLAQVVGVTTGDDDVFELGARGDVAEDVLPAARVGLERELLQLALIDIGADRVAACAEAAVDGAGVEREEERLVGVAMREALHRCVVLLVERVELQLRVVGQDRAADRDELTTKRVLVGVAPVDEREEVRRDAHGHRRLGKTSLCVVNEALRDEPLKRTQELLGLGDRLLHLPFVIEELGLAHIRVRRNALPKVAFEQVAMLERRRVNGRAVLRISHDIEVHRVLQCSVALREGGWMGAP